MITLCNKYNVTNSYVGSDWNFEETTKYIFSNHQKYIEAGYFIHYLKKENELIEKKHVIELPSSYGCMMKCGFCASSQIPDVCSLSVEEIYEIFTYIFQHNNLLYKENVLVSMMGIGDLYFTINNVEKILKRIHDNYKNICFSISSCCWTESMLKRVEALNCIIKFRTIQITYITHDAEKIKNIILYYNHIVYNADELIQMLNQCKIQHFKINYILIKGINDSEEDLLTFISKFKIIKNKLIVRISKINPTYASTKNGLIGSSIGKMEEFRQRLSEAGFQAYLFYSYKDDQMNCGQLVTEKFLVP